MKRRKMSWNIQTRPMEPEAEARFLFELKHLIIQLARRRLSQNGENHEERKRPQGT